MNQGRHILQVRDLHAYYGNIHALQGVSLTIRHGEIVTLIGSNGAGKSTLLNTISGLLSPRAGEVLFNGLRIDRFPPHKIVSSGISQVPEGEKDLQPPHGHGKSGDGCISSEGTGRDQEGHGGLVRPFSAPQGAAQSGRRDPLRG